MLPPFNIYRQDNDEKVLWLDAAASLLEAKVKVAAAMKQVSTRYLIVSVRSGEKQVVYPPKNE